ncbi:DgyrCDS483 [Dimorphilus gyrociliatus]|uniref:DgyrCDS483 n=1 Tax=Dimorphilus gyrociliatus TaxID=2664684 RepID=A0A7I8V4K8_9ANNE|nr:DgyrCDS483 [Dimorphilus gyrociliatus]
MLRNSFKSPSRHTCMHNSPKDLFVSDEKRVKRGEKGRYLLTSFGKLIEPPVIMENKNKGKLRFLFDTSQQTKLRINIKADQLNFLDSQPEAEIVKVTFSGFKAKSEILVYVRNPLRIVSKLSVRLIKCDDDFRSLSQPDTFKSIGPNRVDLFEFHMLPDQKQSEIGKNIKNLKMDMDSFIKGNDSASLNRKISTINQEKVSSKSCLVQVLGERKQVISKRKISYKTKDSCVCLLYCKCTCISDHTKCKPISKEEWQAAGFSGFIPKSRSLFSGHAILIEILLLVCLFGLVMGCMKVLLGSFFIESFNKHGLENFYPLKRNSKRSKSNDFLINCCFFIIAPISLCSSFVNNFRSICGMPLKNSTRKYTLLSLEDNNINLENEKFNEQSIQTEESKERLIIATSIRPNRVNAMSMSTLSLLPVVYLNLIEPTKLLLESGKRFSLAGVLSKFNENSYTFQLGSYTKQLFKLENNQRVLLIPPKSINETDFNLLLKEHEAKGLLSIVPQFPCLNKKDTDYEYY